MLFTNGQVLHNNTIIKLLGVGNFGEVYKTNNASNEKTEALKVFNSLKKPDDKDRFCLENKILHRLKVNDKIIVPHSDVIDCGDGLFYYTMELADCNLTEYLNSKSLEVDKKIELFKSICEGLEHVHNLDIVHRDLWQNNVLIKTKDSDFGIKLTDFGRAKDFKLDSLFSYADGVIGWGIKIICPPECYFKIYDKDNIKMSKKGDIYALGILLYYILNQSNPDVIITKILLDIETSILQETNFLGIDNHTIVERTEIYKNFLNKHSTKNYGWETAIYLISKEANDKINIILNKLLSVDTAKRYDNVADILLDLKSI